MDDKIKDKLSIILELIKSTPSNFQMESFFFDSLDEKKSKMIQLLEAIYDENPEKLDTICRTLSSWRQKRLARFQEMIQKYEEQKEMQQIQKLRMKKEIPPNEDLDLLTVKDLQDLLRRWNLSTRGTKQELRTRIEAFRNS